MDPIAAENFSNLQVDVASLPKYKDVELHPISKKYLVKLQVGTTFSLLFFGIGLMVAYYFVPSEIQNYIIAAAIFIALIFTWTFFNNIMYVRRSGYALREQDMVFQRGFLFERTTVVPFNRIQHVSVERTFLDKILNISSVKVFTAGGSGSDINIPGIYPETAISIKEEISSRIYNHA